MIGYLKGKIMQKTPVGVLLENNGVGYEITCSTQALSGLTIGAVGEVYTYMAVREDDISLYGFKSIEEKNMFLKLITVSGIGPKMGITILSQMSLTDLAVKIATSDVKGLAQVKGLGKKKAEFIIVELREKMGEELKDDNEPKTKKSDQPKQLDDADSKDALLALTGLGFSKQESIDVLLRAKEQNVQGVQALIAYSLKNIK